MTLRYINVKLFIRLIELEKVICFQKGDIDSVFPYPKLHDNL